MAGDENDRERCPAEVNDVARKLFLASPLILTAAILAMLSGHAVEIGIENSGAFAGWRAAYQHAGQAPALLLSVVLLLAALTAAAVRVLRAARSNIQTVATMMPAFHALNKLPRFVLAGALMAVQMAALIAVELGEQYLSGFGASGLAAIFGSGHTSALLVHVLFGSLAAFALGVFSEYVCRRAPVIVRLASALITWFGRLTAASTCGTLRVLALRADSVSPPVLALGIANRPPPSDFVS